MKLLGFTAEASIYQSTEYYVTGEVPSDSSHPLVNLSTFSRLRFPIPFPVPDICGVCIASCIGRGGNYFSCQNLCSFVCV